MALLDNALRNDTALAKLRFRSVNFRDSELLRQATSAIPPTAAQAQKLRDYLIARNRTVSRAVVVASLLRITENRERRRWILTLLFSLVAAVLGAILKELGELNALIP
ncbi:MAG TPA: hypothetical protein VF017_06680 [Thermoanaerobaculia bacterium]|nr:hypothetical protein [Thermoanaerobaculia bacterium]